jgi:hypothetical protein
MRSLFLSAVRRHSHPTCFRISPLWLSGVTFCLIVLRTMLSCRVAATKNSSDTSLPMAFDQPQNLLDKHGLCGLSTRISDAPHSHLYRPTSTATRAFRACVYSGSTAPSKGIYVFHEQPREIWRDILSTSAKSNRGFPI